MADQPDGSSKSKRLVKNPDTFRERAIKAAETSAQPSRANKIRTAVFKPFKPLLEAFSKTPVWRVIKKALGILKKILRFLVPPYLRNSWKELKLVTWPGWKQSRQLTYAVLVFAVIFGTSIALVDFGLDKLFKNILLK
jgi:preprotein translocase SecE subunit